MLYVPAAMSVQQTGWSQDGNWFWDGARWNDSISEDGQWRYDGTSWQPFQGQRTAMPMQAFGPPVAAAPPPSPIPLGAAAPGADPQVAMPSWVAPAEIERLQQEKIERQMAAVAPPPAPLPPELDWRRAGEFMEYHRGPKTYSSWQTGAVSVFIYIFLLWFCGPVSLIFVWMTGWGWIAKGITSFISFAFSALLVLFVIARASVGT